MFEEIVAENGTKFLIAAVAVLLGLLCLALVLWIMRGRPSSPFIRGGRNRTPRLAVLDAAAVDTRRRLVLIRRDDVEHLVMIGGPTDIVIESRIVGASAEAATQRDEEAAPEKEQAVPVRQATATRSEETNTVAATERPVTTPVERRPAETPDGVSAMAKVLYAPDDSPVARPASSVAAARATPTQVQRNDAGQNRQPAGRPEDVLEQARQRVLATPANTTSTRQVAASTVTPARQVTQPVVTKPLASATDNPALVSEFEKILEAEITATAPGTADTARPVPTQGAATGGQGQQAVAKSREETEAEMARLLSEISANRKA